jgi:diguanylate cyclase (GGDEF)-like protein
MRSGDIAARLSGDEYAILLSDTDKDDAFHVAERIRMSVLERQVEVPKTPNAAETVAINTRTSIGIAVAPTHAKTVESLIFAADGALRRAKNLGRNRVEIANPAVPNASF